MATTISKFAPQCVLVFAFLRQLFYRQLLVIFASISLHFQQEEKSKNLPAKRHFEVFGSKSLDLREEYCCLKSTDQNVKFPLEKAVLVVTDIIDSTRLYNANPQKMRCYFDIHTGIVKSLLRKYSGHIVANEGDSFHLVFQHLENAIRFSRELVKRHRESISYFEVRIGVNKGTLCVRRLCGYKVFGKTVDETIEFSRHSCGNRICINGNVLKKHHIKDDTMLCKH